MMFICYISKHFRPNPTTTVSRLARDGSNVLQPSFELFSFLSPKNWQSSQFMVNPVGLGGSVWILKHWTIRDYRLKIGFKIPNLRGQKKKNSASAPSFELEKSMYICKEWMSVPTTNLGWDLTEYIEAIFGITCQQVERDNEKQ